MKAWRVKLWDYPEVVIHGETRGKAVYRLWLDGGSDTYSFATFLKHIKLRRAPELDGQEDA